MSAIAHEQEFVRFFTGATTDGTLKKVPYLAGICQVLDFIDLAVEDGTIKEGDEVPWYVFFDVPCKVMTALEWTPQQFVESSIRAKTLLKGLHPCGITFKVGLLYYLGPPVNASGQTWYAPRCDMASYIERFNVPALEVGSR